MNPRLWIVLVLAVLLSACAVRPVRTALPPGQVAAAEARQVAREARLREHADWSLLGRIAVSNNGNGGSGRIEWRQAGAHFEVALSAPVTRQGWRLSGDRLGARLEGLQGGPRAGPDARLLLLEATGWDIPVVALTDWTRGLRAEGLGPADITYGANALPMRIEQGGWRIDYTWPAAGAADASPADALPTRIDAVQGGARVRLVVDQWGPGGPGA